VFWGKLLIFLALLFWGNCGFSSTCGSQPSKQIRSLVRDNTFKIVPRNIYASSFSSEHARELYDKHCISSPLTISEQMNCATLKNCQGEQCKIEYMPFGTAFWTSENNKLITAWHVVYPTHAPALLFLQNNLMSLSNEELNQTLSVLSPDFVLLDHKDQVIYDTRTAHPKSVYSRWGNPLSTIYQNQGFIKNQPYGFFENAPDDFVAIELSLPNAENRKGLSLLRTNKTSLNGTCLQSVGFQYHNGQLTLSGGQLTAVKDLQAKLSFSTPFQLNPLPLPLEEILNKSISEILGIMGYSEDEIQKMLGKHSDEKLWAAIKVVLQTQSRNMRDQALADHEDVIFFDAPVLPGQSGGPIIDEQGHVVGITTNSFYDKQLLTDNHYTAYGSAGVLIQALRFR
jgi:hypothetical protein